MNLPTIAEWTAELRRLHEIHETTGQRVQTREVLCSPDGAKCCLGVLAVKAGAEVHQGMDDHLCRYHAYGFDPDDPDENDEPQCDENGECAECVRARTIVGLTVEFNFPDIGTFTETALPPAQFMEFYGMDVEGRPLLESRPPTLHALSSMNDGGSSFLEIAEEIEVWKENGWIHDPKESA